MMLFAAGGSDIFRAILQGTPPGTVYALVAIGFVLTYKTSGVFNLAFGAQAYLSAVMYFKTHTEWGWPIIPAVIVSVFLLAPAVGLALEYLIFRHLRTASAVSKLIVTVGLSVALPSLFDMIVRFKSVAGVTPVGVAPEGADVHYDPFGVYPFSRNELVAMFVALVAIAGLGILFAFTGIGLKMRAVVESPRMTELNRIPADRVSAFAWALSSLFAGMAGVLIAPRFNTLSALDFFNIVVIAIAAAAIGKLVSMPRALAGGLGLGIAIAMVNTFLPDLAKGNAFWGAVQKNVTPAIPFLVLFAVIVFVPSIRRARESADPLSGVDPPPTTQAGQRARGGKALARYAVPLAVAAISLVVVFTRGNRAWTFQVTQAVILAVIFLSITVVTGFAGRISLCQGAFAATGALASYQLVSRYGMSVLLAGLVGACIAAGLGALLSLPLRRLSGIWVAIATLAFAYFFDSVLVKLPILGGTESATSTKVPRPRIGNWNLTDDKAFLALCLVVLAAVALAVTLIRRGTVGRTLTALRGSDLAAQAIGISPGRAYLTAFSISAFIAGLGGALLAMQQQNVNYGSNYAPFAALMWLVVVVTLGVRTVEGAIVAAASYSLFEMVVLKGAFVGWILRSQSRIPDFFPLDGKWLVVLFGLGTIQFARRPEGILQAARVKAPRTRSKPAAPSLAPPPPPPPPPAPVAPAGLALTGAPAGPGAPGAMVGAPYPPAQGARYGDGRPVHAPGPGPAAPVGYPPNGTAPRPDDGWAHTAGRSDFLGPGPHEGRT